MALIEQYNEDGQIVAYFSPEGEGELRAVSSMLEMDFQTCPECGEKFEIKPNSCKIKVYNPATPLLGMMNLGEARCHCAKCGAYIRSGEQMELTAFPSIMHIITVAQNQIAATRASAASPMPPRPTTVVETPHISQRFPEEAPVQHPQPQSQPTQRPTQVQSATPPGTRPSRPATKVTKVGGAMKNNPYFRNRKEGSNGR